MRSLLRSTDALVILDEAYMDFWDQSLLGEAEEYDNLVILKTCSKAVGLANIQLGFAVANERITDALRAVKSPYNVNGVSAMIGAAVLEQQGLPARSGRRACRVPAACRGSWNRCCPGKRGVPDLSVAHQLPVRLHAGRRSSLCRPERAGIIVRCLGSHLRITAGSEAENAALTAALDGILV